ncbi:peptidylprolyl isomerase [Amedibacillus sp. YH-ame10]
MIEILKRQWFVVLVAVIFIGFAIFCVYDTNKDRVSGKTHDGKDVVATLSGDKYITADSLYDTLYKNYGGTTVSTKFQVAVISQSVKETSELKTQATNYKANFLTQAETGMSQYGYTDIKSYINAQLANLGYSYDTLDDYAMLCVKINKMSEDYITKNLDALFSPIYEEKSPRKVSHILIKMEDSENPTDAEKKKVKQVEDALAKGDSFAEVAKKYSDDSASAENNGSLGYMDSDTTYVDSFKNKALSMKTGEVSEWVHESNDSYKGWHMIKVEETDKEKLLKDKDIKTGLYEAIQNNNSDIYSKFVWEAAKKLDIKYASDDIKKKIMTSLDIEE